MITLLLRRSASVAAFVLLVCALPALAANTYIYVQTDIGDPLNMNSIAAYSNDGSGNLIALSGSPYLTGGSGINESGGEEFDADQQIVINSAGTLLYTVDGHSNDISVFNINNDGTLKSLRGSPFACGGQDPASIGLSGNVLVVANKDEDPGQTSDGPPNYASFAVRANGGLSKRPGDTIPLGDTSSPAQVLMAPIPNIFFALELGTSRIATFNFDARGAMTELSSISPPGDGSTFLGETLHPTQQILYAGILNQKMVGVYTFDSTGTLTFVRTVVNRGVDICWLRTNAAGTRLYTSESVSGTITVYDLTNALRPKQLQHFKLVNPDGPTYNIEIDPTQNFLYAISGTQLHVMAVDSSGMLSETAAPIDLPGVTSSFQPVGIAVLNK